MLFFSQSTKNNCKGEYRNVDPNNAACVDDLGIFTEVSEKTTCGSYKKCLFFFSFHPDKRRVCEALRNVCLNFHVSCRMYIDIPLAFGSVPRKYILDKYWSLHVSNYPQNLEQGYQSGIQILQQKILQTSSDQLLIFQNLEHGVG